jgi:hypothetical protein
VARLVGKETSLVASLWVKTKKLANFSILKHFYLSYSIGETHADNNSAKNPFPSQSDGENMESNNTLIQEAGIITSFVNDGVNKL